MPGLGVNVSRPVAEISIIVVGVLIALGVDSWNDNRIDRILETQYLERLREDVVYNLGVFEGSPEERFDLKLMYLAEIAELAALPDERVDLNSARYLLSISQIYGRSFPAFQIGTFEELKSTGNLGLIRDLRLRTAINDYDLFIRGSRERVDSQITGYSDYLSRLHPGIEVRSEGERFADTTLPFDVDQDLRNGLRTEEFRRHLYAEINYAEFAKLIAMGLQSESEELLSLLDQALAE